MNPKEFWGTDKPVVAVDIDGTLCEDDSFPNYAEAVPKEDEIAKLRELAEKCFIVLWSARYEADREVTKCWLCKNEVPYDRLILGKLPFDFFIDANAFWDVGEFEFEFSANFKKRPNERRTED